MKRKMWLTRDTNGLYRVWHYTKRPVCYGGFWGGDNLFLGELCPRLTKKWLGLKKHLPKGKKGICTIALDVKCKIVK